MLYMRHGKTDPRQPDLSPMDLDDCDTQRPLTDEGRREITAVGEADGGLGRIDRVLMPVKGRKEGAGFRVQGAGCRRWYLFYVRLKLTCCFYCSQNF